MPRKPREEVAGGIFHVYARGNDRRAIFLDSRDRFTYLDQLGSVVVRQRWWCLGFCLMNNHLHLLLETPRPNLGSGMQRLHGQYAQAFNKRHGSVGHLFQGRYGAVRIRTDAQLWTAIRYIARNPVGAELCDRPEQWRWGSHRAVSRSRAPSWLHHDRLVSLLSGSHQDPRAAYVRLVAD
ncbi:MAG TPA: transposase [Thermoleophilaceae bacterium]|nr:transposase [Thermoleophilaceae bacterium]